MTTESCFLISLDNSQIMQNIGHHVFIHLLIFSFSLSFFFSLTFQLPCLFEIPPASKLFVILKYYISINIFYFLIMFPSESP